MIEAIFEWFLPRLIGFFYGTIAAIVLFPLGVTGMWVKEGIEGGKFLKAVLPIFGWLVVYGLLFYFLPLKVFLYSLILFLIPILGFFGYVAVPKFDLDF